MIISYICYWHQWYWQMVVDEFDEHEDAILEVYSSLIGPTDCVWIVPNTMEVE